MSETRNEDLILGCPGDLRGAECDEDGTLPCGTCKKYFCSGHLINHKCEIPLFHTYQ